MRIAHGPNSVQAGRARNAAMVALTWLEGVEWELGAARLQLASRGRARTPSLPSQWEKATR